MCLRTRHSSISRSCPEIDQVQSAGEESPLTRDITSLFVQRLNFSSKLKATNVSPKHILKSNTLDKIMQTRKKVLSRDSKELFVQRFA